MIHRLLPLLFGACLLAQNPDAGSLRRLWMEDGWQITGLAAMLASHPQKEDTLPSRTGSIRIEVFAVSSSKRLAPFKALFLSRKDDVDYIMWQMIRPKTVFAYSTGGRRFALMVEGVIELAPDPKTGQGGTGPEVRLYFQDPDGSGKWKVMFENLPLDFRPEIPEWVRR